MKTIILKIDDTVFDQANEEHGGKLEEVLKEVVASAARAKRGKLADEAKPTPEPIGEGAVVVEKEVKEGTEEANGDVNGEVK